MDLNNDGVLDIVSGANDCNPEDGNAPVQFFKGIKNKPLSYREPVPLKTLSGGLPDLESLRDFKDPQKNRFVFKDLELGMTKPVLVDLNDDGHLDLIYGENWGCFITFNGTAKSGVSHFSDTAEVLLDEDGGVLDVSLLSCPHFVDWDDDGDFDLISGSADGGVFYAENIGDSKIPKWKDFVEWIPEEAGRIQNAREGIKPWSHTTIFVDDYNGDGKLDLIVGDHSRLVTPHDKISDEEFVKKEMELKALTENNKELDEAKAAYDRAAKSKGDSRKSQRAFEKADKTYQKIFDEVREETAKFRDSYKTTEKVGFVWLFLQK